MLASRVLCAALVSALVAGGGCDCNGGPEMEGPDADVGQACTPPCTDPTVCRYLQCVPVPTACTSDAECLGDQYCDETTSECLPWGVGPGGASNEECKREPVPGVFFPQAQCEWTAPPAGDFDLHTNVLSTPMVASFYRNGEFSNPSVVFVSYNYTDGGGESCIGTLPTDYYGVIRIIDGSSCAQQATISSPTVIPSASVAIADLGGDDETPEIVAARTVGGLVAFTLRSTGWEVLWETTSQIADTLCNWAGPSIHDLDDDGEPEIIFYGAVFDAAGTLIDESLVTTLATNTYSTGTIPIVVDVNSDGTPDLVTGNQIYAWNTTLQTWMPTTALTGGDGHVAVADFGTYPAAGADDRGTLDGLAEIVVVNRGAVRIFTQQGREVFSSALVGLGMRPDIGKGGPPTIADFDGDGRIEFASAGASAYHVFDPDCTGTPTASSCPSLRTDGIAWVQQSQDYSSNTTGSSVFDFDGDERAEVVYGDECFTRVYDGITGFVVYSRYRTSCTWYENPLVVDTDSDFNAEIVSTSNTNCATVCPEVDPIFDGTQCLDDSDCPRATRCGREQPADALGRCRCTIDDDCGGDGFVCLDPIAGPSAAGKVCRASHPATAAATGVRILADSVDRWVNTRSIWNQHAYSVTNINDAGKVPRTSEWLRNWEQPGLNNYRQNTRGENAIPGAIADLTIRQVKVACEAGGAVVTAEVCNRGTEPAARGVPVAVYDAADTVRCTGLTTDNLFPGQCSAVSCQWMGAGGEGEVVVDDRGDSTGTNLECREDNNRAAVTVDCP